MVAAGLWKREDIDRMEAQLFREVNGLTNMISNKAIMNVAYCMRKAWEIVQPLAQRVILHASWLSRQVAALSPRRSSCCRLFS